MAVVLSQFTSSLRTERIAEAMIDSTARIFDLIRAIKDYSYMDQMPIQEVDIPQGLENTLAMVASRLRKVEVIRDYEPNLPGVSAYGRELNQVWTALIENALDAMQDQGEIRLVGPHRRGHAAGGDLGQRSGHSSGAASTHLRAVLHHQGSGKRAGLASM